MLTTFFYFFLNYIIFVNYMIFVIDITVVKKVGSGQHCYAHKDL